MKCIKCGSEMPDNYKFCANCGEKLQEKQTVIEIQSNEIKKEENGFSITSLILGLSSIICFFINIILSVTCSILAIIFGIKGRKKGAKDLGTAGMIIGIIVTSLIVILFILIMIFVAIVGESIIRSIY